MGPALLSALSVSSLEKEDTKLIVFLVPNLSHFYLCLVCTHKRLIGSERVNCLVKLHAFRMATLTLQKFAEMCIECGTRENDFL